MEIKNIHETRTQLGTILNKVAFGCQNFCISRYGKPVAILISLEEWDEFKRLRNAVKIVD